MFGKENLQTDFSFCKNATSRVNTASKRRTHHQKKGQVSKTLQNLTVQPDEGINEAEKECWDDTQHFGQMNPS